MGSLKEFILASVTVEEGGCWIWNGRLDKDGYGYLWDGSVTRNAHRMSYHLFVGPVPDGREVHHYTCDRRACCNPDHMVAVTRKQHRQMHADKQTHCKQGHLRSETNSYTPPGTNRKICRECNRTSAQKYNERRRA